MNAIVQKSLCSALREELHAFAQPLSILQCRLELAVMSGQASDLDEAVRGGLDDVRVLSEHLHKLRELAIALSDAGAA